MPADRTKRSRAKDSEANISFVWKTEETIPSTSCFAFTPTLTPTAFNDDGPPPLVDAPPLMFESIIFPTPENDDQEKPTRRTGHGKKKPENHIPRPPNAFILFRSSFIKSQHVSTEVETNHSTLSKIIGLTWQNLPPDERQVWHAKAKAVLEEHKRKFPSYAFKPTHTKGRGTEKRKVREVGPKDLKRCAKIAELLVEGMKGTELNVAIQEFDRTHVPEIVTRFEAPLTARQYRRSSSVPIPEPEVPFMTTLPAKKVSRRIRSASSQPTRMSTPVITESVPSTPIDDQALFDFASSYPSASFLDSYLPFDLAPAPTTNYFDEQLSYPRHPIPLSIDTSFNSYSCLSPISPSPCLSPYPGAPSPSNSCGISTPIEAHTPPSLDFSFYDMQAPSKQGAEMYNFQQAQPQIYNAPSTHSYEDTGYGGYTVVHGYNGCACEENVNVLPSVNPINVDFSSFSW